MLPQMERSTIKVLAQRGNRQRQIATDLGRRRTTIARALAEPVDTAPAQRRRPSHVDPFGSRLNSGLRSSSRRFGC